MRIVDKCEWSRNSKEEVMKDAISCDELSTKFLNSVVLWEREVGRFGHNPDTGMTPEIESHNICYWILLETSDNIKFDRR